MGMLLICLLIVPLFYAVLLILRLRWKNRLMDIQKPSAPGKKPIVLGFFHPYCNAGGGGERVLWVAIRAIQNKYPDVRCVVYTGDPNVEAILPLAKDRFNITLPRTEPQYLQFVQLKKRRWLEASMYPYFTLLGQSIGSVYVGLEALCKFLPDIYIDSMGYAFTFPVFKYIGGSKVVCYVHYPTISTDMLERVSSRTETYNNQGFISRNPVLSTGKLYYYVLFAKLYGVVGKCSDITMVNSSWTARHIKSLWHCNARVVYPPCNTVQFLQLPLNEKAKTRIIVSVSQFRPEKDQPLQIRAFAKFLQESISNSDRQGYKLVLLGSCRNADDESRVNDLRQLAQSLQVEDLVEFRLNVSFAELKRSVKEATIGLHTMWNEHFGIGVVELMAGGTIVLAHNSGGPKLDIVCDYDGQRTGYLADDVTSYACAMRDIFALTQEEQSDIQGVARQSVQRFADQKFEASFISCVSPLLGE